MGLLRQNPGDAVYGTIAVGALLAAESAHRETYLNTVVAVVIIMVLYWLAHSYADLTGHQLETGARLTRSHLLTALVNELTILIGAVMPVLALVICWILGASLSTAVLAAVLTSAVIIVTIEVLAGVRADLSGRQLFLQALIGALLGLPIIAVEVLLH